MKRVTFLFTFTLISLLLTLTSCQDDNDDIQPIPVNKVYKGSPDLSSFDKLNDFYNEKYTIIDGDLTIKNFETINNLRHLANLQKVTGHVQLNSNPQLESLEGLNNLDSIGGAFNIVNCDKLSNFEGVEKLVSISGDMRIMGNESLVNLAGINKLEYVGGKLKISTCHNMINLKGLESLKVVDHMLEIGNMDDSGNNSLNSIEALSNLKKIKTRLEIKQNPLLTSLHGLDNLETLGSTSIINNASLTDFCSLTGVINNGGQTGTFVTQLNTYNPSSDDIISGDCSNK